MTIDEAIKFLENYPAGLSPDSSIPFTKAIRLGIEALKQIKWLHESHVLHDDELLPGETTE